MDVRWNYLSIPSALRILLEEKHGRDRDRTDDLYRVKVALIPTELRARKIKFYNLIGSERTIGPMKALFAALALRARFVNGIAVIRAGPTLPYGPLRHSADCPWHGADHRARRTRLSHAFCRAHVS